MLGPMMHIQKSKWWVVWLVLLWVPWWGQWMVLLHRL